jgi:hypothetical protein
MKKIRTIPFDFVLEQLYSVAPVVKPMFGCHAVYVKEKIVLMLRNKEDFPDDNGVWIATTAEHHESLRRNFPSMRSIGMFSGKITGWQNLPYEAGDFEESAIKACDLILKKDPRIGKVPKPRKKKKKL